MSCRDLFAYTDHMRQLTDRVIDHARSRIAHDLEPLRPAPDAAELDRALSGVITAEGIGADRAFDLFSHVIAPNCLAVDHPRFLSFVAHPPSTAALIFDMALSASAIFGTSWMESAGATAAENQALRWLADLAGMPEGAGGVFLSGATVANFNALAAARAWWRATHPVSEGRLGVAMTAEAHASAKMVARVLELEIVPVAEDERGRMIGLAVERALADPPVEVCAVVATGGITNVGIVDDLAGAAEISRSHGLWFHVDAAYGGAAMTVERTRPLFNGIERADSFVIDPHKWLFTPLDCSALIYRDPAHAKAAFTQHADYIAAMQGVGNWNPGDYGIHLTRRARGLPFWFMLATYGTDAIAAAVGHGIDLAMETAREIECRPELTLVMEPELSVVIFKRNGWAMANYQAWSDRMLATGTAFVLPTLVHGEPVLRLCFVNPRTTMDDVRLILDSLT